MLELHTPQEGADWLRSRVSATLQTDSRKVRPGDGFLAWPGATVDARRHVAAALSSGASACLVERTSVEEFAFSADQVAAYPDLKAHSGLIADIFFGHPTRQLDVLAVTGTNGKTSTAWWLAQALSNLKQGAPIPCGFVGTLGVGRVPDIASTGLTTPDAVLLQQTFRQFVDTGVKACAIEASSIGLQQQRLAGSRIRCAIFTNFTQDHLDYHGTMESYWQSKEQLFAWPGLQSAVLNIDDDRGARLASALTGKVADVWTVSVLGPARLQARAIRYDAHGLCFNVVESDARGALTADAGHLLQTRLIGQYNVSNLLGVMAAMRSMGVPLAGVVEACSDLMPVPGRMQCVGAPGQPLVVVDYAHTPDALGKALLALRGLADQRAGKLCCVFGCGGDRDATKRPLMGAIAASHADRLVVTSDNPRSEKPEAIISQILLGLSGHPALTVEPDRASAIRQSVAQASASDVVLIAGKGHEDYQEVAGQRLAFSDLAHARSALSSWVTPTGAPGSTHE